MVFMIVDDNAAMRKAIRGIVAEKTDTVIECANGIEAVDSFGKVRPDWVLMDIQMPKMDGIQAMKKILQSDAMAKVVIVTDFDTESFRSAAKNVGATAYISKEDLFELLNYIQH